MNQNYTNTLNGHSSDVSPVIFEHLFGQNDQDIQYVYETITLENLEQVRSNPKCCRENLVMNDVALMAHELRDYKGIIATGCNDIAKLQQLQQMCPQITIAAGYQHQISLNAANEQLHSADNLTKKLQLEITLGTNGILPAFIGFVALHSIDINNPIWNNIVHSYLTVAIKYRIPIVLDMDHQDTPTLQHFLGKQCNIILINVPVTIDTKLNPIELSKWFHALLKQGVNLVFSEQQHKLVRLLIDQLSSIYPAQVAWTAGIKYKSQLKKYGGNGFNSYATSPTWLQWAQKQVIVEEVIKWTCPMCKLDFDGQLERIKKFDQEYCSIKCMRLALKSNK